MAFWKGCVVCLAFAMLAVGMTYPVAFRLEDSAFVDWNDTAYCIWALGWNFHKFSTGLSDFFDANIFYPAENTLAFSESLVGLALLAYPVYKITGNLVFCHQLLVLLSFFLSAVGAYLLALRLTGQRQAAFLAGIAFSFCQYRFGQIHLLSEISTQWIPFAFLFMHRFLEGGLRWRDLSGFLLFYVLTALTCLYYGVILALFSGLGILLLAHQRGYLVRPAFWGRMALFSLCALVLLGPVLKPHLEAKGELGTNVSLVEVIGFSPDLVHILAPSSFQWLMRGLTEWVSGFPQDGASLLQRGTVRLLKVFHRHECGLSLGIFTAGLAWAGLRAKTRLQGPVRQEHDHSKARMKRSFALLRKTLLAGLVLLWIACWARNQIPATLLASLLVAICLLVWFSRSASAKHRLKTFLGSLESGQRTYLFIAAFATAFTFGPVWMLLERPLCLGPWLPFLFLPGLNMLRHTARMQAVAMLAWSVLAAYGVKELQKTNRSRKRSGLVVSVAALALLIENFSAPLPLTQLHTQKDLPEVYRWIRENAGQAPIVEAPFVAAKEATASRIPEAWRWVWRVPFAREEERGSSYDRTMFAWVRENVPNTWAQYHSIYHGRKLLNGYSAYTPETYVFLKERMHDFPSRASIAALQAFGAEHLILHTDFYDPEDLARVRRSLREQRPEWKLIGAFGGDELYRIPAPAEASSRLAGKVLSRLHLPLEVGRNQLVSASIGLLNTGEIPLVLHPAPEPDLRLVLSAEEGDPPWPEKTFKLKWPRVLEEGKEALVRFDFTTPAQEGQYLAQLACRDPLTSEQKTLEQRIRVRAAMRDSREPGLLKATLTPVAFPESVLPGQRFEVKVRVRNEGDTLWLAPNRTMREGRLLRGWYDVRLDSMDWIDSRGQSFQVHRNFVYLGASIETYLSGFLPSHVSPGQEAEVSCLLVAPPVPGHYTVRLQLFNERFGLKGVGRTPFPAEHSEPLTLPVLVREP